jgi:hypothetical protein
MDSNYTIPIRLTIPNTQQVLVTTYDTISSNVSIHTGEDSDSFKVKNKKSCPRA